MLPTLLCCSSSVQIPSHAGSRRLIAVVLAATLLASRPALGAAAQGTQPTVDFTAGSQSGPEDAGTLTVTVQLSAASGSNVEVPFTLSGTATLPDDYTATASPVTIPAGDLSADITLMLVDDALNEADETIVLTMGTPVGAVAGTTTVHTATVIDDDPEPTASFALLRQEVDESVGVVPVQVDLSTVSGREVTIEFVSAGSADIPQDYTLAGSPLVIPAGSTNADLLVMVIDDFVATEGPETVILRLENPSGAVLHPVLFRHGLTILDNDSPTWNPDVRGLAASVSNIDFPATRVDELTRPVTVLVTNQQALPIAFDGILALGQNPDEFTVVYSQPPPVMLQPGQFASFDAYFSPLEGGQKRARLVVRQTPHASPRTEIFVRGTAYGPTGEEIRANAGYDAYVDSDLQVWIPDYGVSGDSVVFAGVQPIQGTEEDGLYQIQRAGNPFGYAFDLPNGTYEVTLHFAEILFDSDGSRIFDVLVEGVPEVEDLDIRATVGFLTAHQELVRTVVSDGQLNIDLAASTGEAAVAAIEVKSIPLVSSDVTALDFGTVGQGTLVDLPMRLANGGLHDGVIDRITFEVPAGGQVSGHDFYILIDGQTYYGNHDTVTYPVSIPVPALSTVHATVTFEPTVEEVNALTLRIEGNFDPLEIAVSGTGDHNLDWGFLHPVITIVPELIVDYDGDLREIVDLFGNGSHTHETGVEITEREWKANGVTFSTSVDTVGDFPLGNTPITLTIRDDSTPQGEATDGRTVSVYEADQVPGILEYFYEGGGQNLVTLLDDPPPMVDFIDRIGNLQTLAVAGFVGGSPYTGDVVVRWIADFGVPQPAIYDFTLTGGTGGVDHRLYVDDQPVTGPLSSLSIGKHDLDARFAVATLADLPLLLSVSIDGLVDGQFAAALTHDENGILPVIHAMPTAGSELGGDLITIQGFGFYPEDQVTVKWGLIATLTAADFQSYGAEQVEFFSPAGTGTIAVSIETPAGESNSIGYSYSPNFVPIKFTRLDDEFVQITRATTGDWGPDGRFYVGTLDGEIKAITFDENYHATDVATYVGVRDLTNPHLLGIAFNPWDPPSPVTLYVAHGEHYQNGGGAFSGPSDYTGQVSVLTGPNFDSPVPLITQLPVSNQDHGINGMVFDNNGDLLICVGGNTNAGVQWPNLGDLPASPLSGAIVKAETSRPDFNGALRYVETATQTVSDDQVFGEIVDIAPGTHVTVHASGLRNSYDLLLATNNYLYATDNGPNLGLGPASTGPTTDSGVHPHRDDELNLVELGNYYGHPNRNRGRYFPWENIWRDDVESSIPGEFTQMMEDFNSSTDGITEYRASSFNSQMRGQLIVQKYGGSPRRIELTPDGRGVVSHSNITPQIKGLDVVTGPGGAILTCEYQQNSGWVKMLVPDDPSALVGVKIYDIFPWRAPSTGGTPFVIGGEGFGTLANTTVMIGGSPSTLTSVSTKRIKGTIPPNPAWTTSFLTIDVYVGLDQDSLPQGFRYLGPTPALEPGFWKSGASMPDDVGEVACGVIDGIVYLVGQGSNKTFAYDILIDTWTDNLAVRPFIGHHHSAEVIDGKLYLIGSLGGDGGRVQFYDPVADTWTEGDSMPWNAGSVQTCVIDGKLYAAGGIVGSSTVANVWRYDPAIDQWDAGPLADIPTPVNHAAAATDGTRFYVFGGRAGPNEVQPGFDVVQIYDPGTNTWDSSGLGDSTLTPMPHGRGGTGRAVWYEGEFYVFGGETNDSGDVLADPGQVFPQVNVYDPATNAWREDLRMPTARHGIYPVLFQSRIFIAGGGVVSASSQANILEIFSRQ
ncbi:MAG: hypothetical protein E2O39_10265 [Planctomycetota bacterium]|nr:MAG: hypothetical protein E2O39_10265 [Planctomycetota bacterium]